MVNTNIYSKKQADILLNADARYNILHGSVRSGKTYILGELLIKRVKKQPEGSCLLVGKTERTLQRNVLDPLRERYGNYYVSSIYGGGKAKIFGREFYCVGANDERAVTKIQGVGLVYAYCDELTTYPQNFFEMLKSRLDSKNSKCDCSANPEGPYHWVKTSLLDRRGELNLKDWHFEIDDGKDFLDKEFIEEIKKEYTGVWYKRYILGLWVMAEGVIYDMFSDKENVIEKLDFDTEEDNLKYYVSIDYGTNNPCVFGLYAVRGEQVRKIKEYYYDSNAEGRQKTDSQYSKDLANFIDGFDITRIFIDPSATSMRAQLRADGFTQVRKAKNAVLDGIKSVSKKLSDGSYKILSGCRNTIKEKSTYVWDSRASQRGEDKPLKENDHCSDEERYFIHTKFGRAKLKAGKNF